MSWYPFKAGESELVVSRNNIEFTMVRDETALSLFVKTLGTHASCDNLLFEEQDIQAEMFADLRAYNEEHMRYCGSLKANHLKSGDKIQVEWDLGAAQAPKFAEIILLCSVARFTVDSVTLGEMFKKLAAYP